MNGIVLGACRQRSLAYERIGQSNHGFRNTQHGNPVQRFEPARGGLSVAPSSFLDREGGRAELEPPASSDECL